MNDAASLLEQVASGRGAELARRRTTIGSEATEGSRGIAKHGLVEAYLFRPAAKQLHDQASGKRLRLTEKEAAILKFLYRAGGKPVPRQILLNEVWGYNSNVTTHTLETHIYRLRQKIEPNPAETRILVTETGGYRLELASAGEAA